MGRPLDRLSINGFKSIRKLDGLELGALNLLVGANGAGKSNFVDFFRMLRAMAEGGLEAFVTRSGGADGFFYLGPKETPVIDAQLSFGKNGYRFKLQPTADAEIMVAEEGAYWQGNDKWSTWATGSKTPSLSKWKNPRSSWHGGPTVETHVYSAISSWVVYHLHDTSATAAMRRDHSIGNWRELQPDAGNIAPFLHKLRGTLASRYDRIRATVTEIAPFFDDFILEPQTKGENEVVRLEWKQRGSSFPFQPWQFSDGTMRFICLATALLQPSPPSTIVIDEPELGLNPYALEMLAQLVKEAATHTQVIVSTQSAPLLSQFEPEDVIVVDRAEGASRFQRLHADSLREWLAEYSLGELLQKNVIEAGPQHA